MKYWVLFLGEGGRGQAVVSLEQDAVLGNCLYHPHQKLWLNPTQTPLLLFTEMKENRQREGGVQEVWGGGGGRVSPLYKSQYCMSRPCHVALMLSLMPSVVTALVQYWTILLNGSLKQPHRQNPVLFKEPCIPSLLEMVHITLTT